MTTTRLGTHAPAGSAGDTEAERSALLLVRRIPWWLPVALLAVGLRLLPIDDAWSAHPSDFHGLLGAFATGGPVTELAQRGLFATGGMPVEWTVELADGSSATRYYMHHPPTFMLLCALFVQALGVHEYALRLPALLFSLFSIVATYVFARRAAPESVARFATLCMAVVPFSSRDGMQPWTEGALAGTTALVVAFALRYMDERRTRDLALATGWLALGGLLDWPAYFVLPGLGLWGLVRCTREGSWGRLTRALVMPAVAVLLLAVHKLHMVLVTGADEAVTDTRGALTHMSWSKVAPDFLAFIEFLERQLAYSSFGFTPVVLVLFAIGAVALFSKRSDVRAAAVWLALAPGLIYVFLFPGRSTNHTFFMLVSAPAVCLAASHGAHVLARLAKRLSAHGPRAVFAVLAIAISVWSTTNVVTAWRQFRSNELRVLAAQEWLAPVLSDGDAVVLTHLGRGTSLAFYSRAPIVYAIGGVADYERFVHTIVDRVQPERRAVFLVDGAWMVRNPALLPLLEILSTHPGAQRQDVDLGRGVESFLMVDLPTGAALPR